ncbi:MAG TPA: hypothetical protein VFT74_07740, partial [Isosphaeraceae bacterium]|nr:hypothetical protein [Isosphaeraceae bacterium]
MTTQRWLIGFLALAVNAGPRDLARADDGAVPRYRLEVGEVLNYEGTYEFHYDERPKDGHGDRAKTTIWVVDREEDGGWTIVLRRLMTSYYRREGRTIEQAPQAETITFRLFDDGRIVTGDEVESLIRIEEYFPRLPQDSDAAGKGWQSHTPHEDRVLQFERAPEEDRPGRWAFHATAKHPMDP